MNNNDYWSSPELERIKVQIAVMEVLLARAEGEGTFTMRACTAYEIARQVADKLQKEARP